MVDIDIAVVLVQVKHHRLAVSFTIVAIVMVSRQKSDTSIDVRKVVSECHVKSTVFFRSMAISSRKHEVSNMNETVKAITCLADVVSQFLSCFLSTAKRPMCILVDQ